MNLSILSVKNWLKKVGKNLQNLLFAGLFFAYKVFF